MAVTGSVTITIQGLMRGPVSPVALVALSWTSDASGNVSGNLTDWLVGELLRACFIPGTGGAEPSDGYAATVLDSSGLDILAGQGATLSNTSTTHVCPAVLMTDGAHATCRPMVINDKLDLVISGAGNDL